jgi:hypothetical protein
LIKFEDSLLERLFERTQETLSSFLDAWKEGEFISLNSDWLTGWFILRLAQQELHLEVMRSNWLSSNQKAFFFKHLSVVHLYVIHCMKNAWDPTAFAFSDVPKGYESVIESKLFLIAEYAHLKLDLPRSVSLYLKLKQMWANEAILYTTRDTYREHLHHAMDICLLGLLLIDCGLLGKLCPQVTGSAKDKRNWVLAALLHDIGYGLHMTEDILERAKFLGISPMLDAHLKKLKQALEKHKVTLTCDMQRHWVKDHHEIYEARHGAVSALLVSALNTDLIAEEPDQKWINEIRPALSAIIHHDNPDDNVDPSEEPLSFLLLLCDHLQEWDRPRVDTSFRYFLAANLIRASGAMPSTTTLVKYLNVNLSTSGSGKDWHLHLPEGNLELQLVYKDSGKESFEPAMLWVNNSYDFQKVMLDKMDFNVQILFRHTLAETLCDLKKIGPLSEMDLFHDFVIECEESPPLTAYFAKWLEVSRDRQKSGKPGWLEYNYEPAKVGQPPEEIFTIRLGKTFERGMNNPIPKMPDKIYTKYHKWKKKRLELIKSRMI